MVYGPSLDPACVGVRIWKHETSHGRCLTCLKPVLVIKSWNCNAADSKFIETKDILLILTLSYKILLSVCDKENICCNN